MTRIAYLGPEGTFTEAALLRMAAAGAVPGSAAGASVQPQPADSAQAEEEGETDAEQADESRQQGPGGIG